MNNRDREPDRESHRQQKYQWATGQRGRNVKIVAGSRTERDGEG